VSDPVSNAQRPIRSAEDLAHHQRTLDCVHCGLCLASCPTYELFGRETTSPRGRIYAMRGLAEGEIAPSAALTRDLDLCLVCRACEPVCPSGVKFSEMMEFTRSEILEPTRSRTLKDRIKAFMLRHVIPYPARLRPIAGLLAFYAQSGLRSLLRRYGVLRFISAETAARDDLMPRIPPAKERARLPKQTLSGMGHRGRVAVLEGCVMPLLLGDVNRATVKVLAQQGFEVVVPRDDACCGALCAHFGQLDAARDAARRTMRAFSKLGPVDAIVVNSAGCGAAMKEYGRLFDHVPGVDAAESAAAKAFAEKVKDVTEFLAAQGVRDPGGRLDVSVAYADACHLAHAQGVREPPRRLLESIPGVTLVPLERSDRCCGAAGLYNALNPEESMQLLEMKMAELGRSGARVLATANPGCLLQYRAGVNKANLPIEVVHPVELFARAIENGTPRSSTP
jgi:glycolate oxidase iron-sulfur subunit